MRWQIAHNCKQFNERKRYCLYYYYYSYRGYRGSWTQPPELSVTLGNTIVDWRRRYMTSFIGWTLLKELSISSVWRSTGVCTDRHLGTSPTTSSQPLTLLRAVVVYDLPTWTVSRYLAVDLARMAVGLFITLARQSGTRCQMNLEI